MLIVEVLLNLTFLAQQPNDFLVLWQIPINLVKYSKLDNL